MRTVRSGVLVALVSAAGLSVGGNEARLIDAVKGGDRTAVRAWLARSGDVNAVEPDGTAALHWAARGDDVETARLLIRAGANVNASNRYGVTPLSLAAANGNAAMVDALLEAGADLHTRLSGGQTILMTAARSGNPAVVRALIARGADVNAKEDLLGETALIWAAVENHAETAKLLLDAGADANVRSKSVPFPRDRFGLEGVLTILPKGSWTPLMYAARQGALDAARTIADAGADLNQTDPDSTTALVIAIINGHFDVAALLAEKGADPNIADVAGMAALYATVDMNTLGEVYGRPDRQPASSVTALDLMQVLLAHGADPNAQLKSPAMQRAHTPGEFTLGEGTTPIMRAARNGDAAAMRLLLAHGADPALPQRNHTTSLMMAAGLGRGLGVFAKDYATESELLEAVKVLVDHGVDVNAFNDSGQTALHFAAQASDAIVKLLADHGAKLDAIDKQGRTPIDVALGVGGRGRAGGPAPVREGTAALLRQLIEERDRKAVPTP
jgi:ankyrin repeat protein